MSELPSNFAPQEIEGALYEKWLKAGYFTADSKSDKPPFCIVIPPPNVTGSLHIGHALDHTLQDILIRMKRMKGFETLWLPGMDHAGIATQNVVERKLAEQGKSRHDFSREEFVKKVWEWKAESGGAILGQMKRLGDSVDWSRERFTMDEGLSEAVLTIFKQLYDAGLIYRAERIINWCVRCRTALSDIEVDYQEIDGEFVQIRYGDLDGDHVFIATTRPETMLGDGAVAVNPNDERYKAMIGKKVRLPYVNRLIPIIADELVDPEFGTGAVKVTAAHDPNDFEMGLRHNVPMIIIMNEAGVMEGTGTQFDGMDRFAARKAVVEQLRADGLLGWEKRPYKHSVGHCSRCNTIVEPRLSMQWFVKVAPLQRWQVTQFEMNVLLSHQKNWSQGISTGSITCMIGVFRANFGGDIESQSGTDQTVKWKLLDLARARQKVGRKMKMFLILGFPLLFGHSQRLAGQQKLMI